MKGSLPGSCILSFPSCLCGTQQQMVCKTVPPTHRWGCLRPPEGDFPVTSVVPQWVVSCLPAPTCSTSANLSAVRSESQPRGGVGGLLQFAPSLGILPQP